MPNERPHRYHLVHEPDGDYVVWESRRDTHHSTTAFPGARVWVEHTRWLIPGTQLE